MRRSAKSHDRLSRRQRRQASRASRASRARPAQAEQLTRRPLVPWDRLKFSILLVAVWFFAVWFQMANDPVLGFADAARQQLQVSSGFGRWLGLLLAIELIRQFSYLMAERSRRYYRTSNAVFGRSEQVTHKMSDYTRFRISRAMKWLIVIAVVAVIFGLVYHTSPLLGLFQVPASVGHYLPQIVLILFYLVFGISQFAAIFWFLSRGGVDIYYPGDVRTRFGDVWGQDHVLAKVQENILYLEDPESIEQHGGYVPGGILLWGPPGTGKTLMAEAIAGETGKPYVFVDPGAFINMFFGVGVLKVKSLFRKLRKLAVRYGGVIVFFDEADSLGSRGGSTGGQGGPQSQAAPGGPFASCHGFSYLTRDSQTVVMTQADAARAGADAARADAAPAAAASRADVARAGADAAGATPGQRRPGRFRQMIPAGMGGGGGMGTLQALLTEMSGLKKPRGFFNRVVRRTLGMRPKPPPKYRILIVMATNMPSALDEALLRPGRIDRMYRVGYPSKEGRKRTYEGYFAKVSHEITAEQMDHLATITPYATGATIKDLVNESLIVALRNDRTTITWADVLHAKLAKSVGPSEGVEYIERERHAVALHEACHAVISHLVQKRNVIDTATIQKGADYLGFVKPIPIEEQFTSWRSEYEADIMVSLASLVGERMFFEGDSSSGVSGDLQNATAISLAMEGLWGMGGQYGSYAATRAPHGAHPVADGNDRNVLETALGRRAEAHLSTLAEQTGALLTEHRASVLSVGHALEMYRTISGQDVTAIINGEQGPVVDGRPYRESDFLAELEAYHLRAVSAHGGDRGLPLPVPLSHPEPELTALPAVTDHRADASD
jgi:cell division protease FtsH